MSNFTVADLLGVRSTSIQWERPFLFFGAYFFSNIIAINFMAWSTSSVDSSISIEWINILPPSTWLNFLFYNLLLVAIAVASYRWVANSMVSLALVAVAYPLLRRVLLYVVNMPEAGSGYFEWLWSPMQILQSVVWTAAFFGCIALALQRIKILWLALMVGAIVGGVVTDVFGIARALITGEEIRWSMQVLDFFRGSFSEAAFGGLYWAGLRFASGGTLEVKDESLRLSRGFYVGTMSATYGIALVVILAANLFQLTGDWSSRSEAGDVLSLIGVALLILTYGVVVFCRLIYKMWAAIQDGHARATPGKAVGFLFIPFYNFYWGFQAFAGFARDYNAYVKRHSLTAPALHPGLFTAYMVLCLVAIVPVLSLLVVLANYVVAMLMVSRICDAVNAIPQEHQAVK